MRKNYRVFSKEINRLIGLACRPILLSVFLFFTLAGGVKANNGPETEGEEWLAVQACDVFQESNGVVVVQAETKTAGGWTKKSDNGSGYLEWNGQEYFSKPVGGKITYKVKFNSTGIYRFVWRSKINQGNDDAEHNDTWLKFPNNSNITFFGHKRNTGNVEADLKAKKNVVFPKGSGLSPIPAGSSNDGYFKVYMNRLGWKWVSLTSDFDPHYIYVNVKQPGTYEMQIAGRSHKHAIDGMILYHIGKKGNNMSDGALDNLLKSVKDCSDIPTDPDPEPDNSAPTISSITNQSITEGQTASVKINAADKDGDNISLSVVIKKGSNTLPSGRYTFVSKNNGTLGQLTFPSQKGDAGEYQVTVNAGDGKASSSKTFKITVIKQGDPDPDPDPDPSPGDGKIAIYLVNATNNQDIKELENNSSFGIGVVGIRAAPGVKVTNGVRFILTGGPNNITYRNKEGEIAPYSLFDDKGTKILPWDNIKAGSYKLVVEVVGTNVSKTINFTVTGKGDPNPDPNPDPDPTPGNGKITIYLVNAINNQDIKELEDKSSFATGVVGIRAATDVPVTRGVRFTLTGGPNNMRYRHKEGAIKPHSLFGDKGTKILPWDNIKTGNYKLLVEVLGTNTSKTINFAVTGGSKARVAQSSNTEKTTVTPEGEQIYSDFKIARFYPNPVADELTVEYTGQAEEEGIRLQLVNRLGVVYPLNARTYQIDGSTIKVNMKGLNLSAGVYVLKVEYLNTGKAEVFRLIKY